MKRIILFALIASVSAFGLVACGDGANDSKQGVNSKTTAQTPIFKPFIVANNFSDRDWKNGVFQKDGRTNIFYILQSESEPLKFKVGDSLVFAKSGKVTITRVIPTTTSHNGKISVFVTLDRDIDPIADGYPNKIYLQE